MTFCFGSFTFCLASDYQVVFGNGCRAPSWRQLHGDISYIEVKFLDENPVYITANTQGYFVNKVKWINYSCCICPWKGAALMPRNWIHMNIGNQTHWHKKGLKSVCTCSPVHTHMHTFRPMPTPTPTHTHPHPPTNPHPPTPTHTHPHPPTHPHIYTSG